MKRPEIILHSLPLHELLKLIENFQSRDCFWLENEYNNCESKSAHYRERLDWNNQRYEYISEFLNRCKAYEITVIDFAKRRAIEEAKLRGKNRKYRLTIVLEGSNPPQFYIN